MKASELNINLLYINVCGLKSKLNIPEFNELIQTCDIVTCVETKLVKATSEQRIKIVS